MAGHDIMVVGASVGGVEALSQLVQGIAPDFPGSIFIVLHLPGDYESILPTILSRYTRLQVVHPKDKGAH